MTELSLKLGILINKLKNRNNQAYVFFDNTLLNLNDDSKKKEALSNLLSSFSIVQYANFTNEEEELMTSIWELAKSESMNNEN